MSAPHAGSPEAWIAEERELLRVARRAVVRSARRPFLVLGIALAVTAGSTVLRALKDPMYEATVHFRIDEGDLTDPSNVPRPPGDIREQVSSVALSRHRLEQIMRKYRRSVSWLEVNREAAIEDFREDIGIAVTRDYFIYGRNPGDPPRSALLSLSLQGTDPEETMAMLREIGDAVLQAQAGQRKAHLLQTRDALAAQLEAARRRSRDLQRDAGRLWIQAMRADASRSPQIEAQIAALEVESQSALEQVLALERRFAAIEFSTAAEENQLGLSFARFDESLVALSPKLGLRQLAQRAVLVLLLSLLLTGTVVGSLDGRVYTAEDLAVRGLPCLGELPAFPGDDAGSHRTRTLPGHA